MSYLRSKNIGRTILTIMAILFVYFSFFFPSITKTINLKNDGVEIIGKTTKWINTNDSRMIEYSFELNGKTYKKICDAVYFGNEISGIICPEGKYVVLYDKNDPNNSVMDFKRPTKYKWS